MNLPEFQLPTWLNKGNVFALSKAAYDFFSNLLNWVQFPILQLDARECSEKVLDLIAWQRDIERFKNEPLSLYRLRVHHAYANARDAGSVDGFKKIFARLGIGYVEIEERIGGQDWDVINIRLSDSQLAENQALLDVLIQHYGRTCRRYGWQIITVLPIEAHVAEFGNEWQTYVAVQE